MMRTVLMTTLLLAGASQLVLAQAAPAGAPVVQGGAGVLTDGEAAMQSAQGLLASGQYGAAVDAYKKLINQPNEITRSQARYALAIAQSQMGQDEAALRSLEGIVANNQSALARAVGDLRAALLLQLADKALAEDGAEAAASWLGQYDRLPDKPVTGEPFARYQRLQAVVRGDSNYVADTTEPTLRVGVLLPLSGPLAVVGNDVLRGMELAVFKLPVYGGAKVVLYPQDTAKDGPDAATRRLLQLGVDVIAGPLLGKEVAAVSPLAQATGVPVISFSTDRGAAKGAHLFGHLPHAQAAAVVAHAKSKGLSRLAALVPSTPYGYEVFDAFRDAAQEAGLDVTANAFYNPQNVDVGANIRTLVTTQQVNGKPVYTPRFDALFVPAPAKSLPLIVSQLAYYDVDKAGVQLLGTALWQDPSVLKPSARDIRGGVFAVPPKVPAFDEVFTATFGAASKGQAINGFDLMRVLADLAAERLRTGQPVAELLYRPEGFYGSGGYVRFKPNGLTERGLNVVEVTADGFHVIRPAPLLAPVPVPSVLRPPIDKGWWW